MRPWAPGETEGYTLGYDFELDGQTTLVHPTSAATDGQGTGLFALKMDGRPLQISLTGGEETGEFLADINGRRERVFIASANNGHGEVHFIHFRGRAHRVESINALERAKQEAAPAGGDEALLAPMPGVVVEIATRVGALVEAGELLLTIESMKLQTAIVSPSVARVAEINVSTGANFEQGAVLVRLEATEDESGEPK